MADLKPCASLSSSLLARKGQAKPAMRPQAYASPSPNEDLGWNDMGDAAQRPEPAKVVEPEVTLPAPLSTALPTAEIVPISPARMGLLARAKAAFTLRLDPDRHLRLRLACAVGHRSAQQIVTQALDDYLNTMPEIDALADKIPARGKH